MEHLRFETIEQVDNGSIALAVNQALRQAYTDCQDREHISKARKITLEISVKPELVGGNFEYAAVEFQVKTSFPAKGISIPMKATREGLGFQPDAPDNPDQSTLEFDRDEEGGK